MNKCANDKEPKKDAYTNLDKFFNNLIAKSLTNSLEETEKHEVNYYLTLVRDLIAKGIIKDPKFKMPKNVTPEQDSNNNPKELPSSDNNANNKHSGRKPGQGNLSVKDYKNAEVTKNDFNSLVSGCVCPECNNGKLYTVKPSRKLLFIANPIITPTISEEGRLRCNNCKKTLAPVLHPNLKNCLNKATPKAAATSITLRYGLGFPDFRLDMLQEYMDAKFSHSNQWDITDQAYDLCLPVINKLINEAADSDNVTLDDGNTRIRDIKKIINAEVEIAESKGKTIKDVRTGINTTCFKATTSDKKIINLFMSGREHQGENLFSLQKRRSKTEPLVVTSDAASKAKSLKSFPEKNTDGYTSIKTKSNKKQSEIHVSADSIFTHCLQHLREKFIEIKGVNKKLTNNVLELIGKIYQNEKVVVKNSMDDIERLKYHQEHSSSITNSLLELLQSEANKVENEANGTVQTALTYGLGHWDALTKFLKIPGVPLDTNHAESLVKFTKRHLKNSLFYYSARGAAVGDGMMTLISTAIVNKTNPIKYLAALLEFPEISSKNPELWLPWNFEASYANSKKQQQQSYKIQLQNQEYQVVCKKVKIRKTE